MLRQVTILVMIISTLFVHPFTVEAQDSATVEEAREHFHRGEAAFSQSRWLDCATHFEASFQAVFSPVILYNIGLCYERAADAAEGDEALSHRERALAAYTRYLRELPTSEDAPVIRIRIADLRTILERARSVNEVEEVPVEEPEPVVVEEVSPVDEEISTEPEVSVVTPADRGFGFGWTLTAGSFTVATFVTAIGLSVAAQEQFNSCLLSADCTDSDIQGLADLAMGANAMYIVSGVLLAATGVAFGLEFQFWSTPTETHVGLGYSTSF